MQGPPFFFQIPLLVNQGLPFNVSWVVMPKSTTEFPTDPSSRCAFIFVYNARFIKQPWTRSTFRFYHKALFRLILATLIHRVASKGSMSLAVAYLARRSGQTPSKLARPVAATHTWTYSCLPEKQLKIIRVSVNRGCNWAWNPYINIVKLITPRSKKSDSCDSSNRISTVAVVISSFTGYFTFSFWKSPNKQQSSWFNMEIYRLDRRRGKTA